MCDSIDEQFLFYSFHCINFISFKDELKGLCQTKDFKKKLVMNLAGRSLEFISRSVLLNHSESQLPASEAEAESVLRTLQPEAEQEVVFNPSVPQP